MEPTPTPIPLPDLNLPPLIPGISQGQLTLIILGIFIVVVLILAIAPLIIDNITELSCRISSKRYANRISRKKYPKPSKAASKHPPTKPTVNHYPFTDLPDPEPEEEILPYQLKSSLLTRAEISFYHVLRRTAKDTVAIFTQVPISAIVYPQTGDRRLNHSYRNKINRKTVDFLLCDAQTLAPLAGIELDDISHQRADRVERDTFVNSIFEHAQLSLIRIPAKSGYNLARLTEDLTNAGIDCNTSG